MINTPKSKATDTIKFEVTEYPIGFPYFSNPDGTPQLKIMAGTEELQLDYNCKLSEDGQTLILIPTEEQAETLSGPEDYSWMLPLVGKQLVVERDVPFIQESDYQLGRISSEQIEKDLDKSVMRDQEIRNQADKDRGLIKECQQGIATNAANIQKVREDFVAEDAKINKRIDDHAKELDAIHKVQTTANTNIESNAKAIQQTRDDFTAADSVLRKDIDNNKSDIAKLRDDMNASDTSLQGQITAQAAKIATKQDKLTAGDNIIIKGNVISATGAGGAGLSFIVYDTLPETGESGFIYLVPKDSEAPDVYDEYVWIKATQTFELIGSTQVDLTDYAKKEYVDNAIAGFESFPDQTGNAGKFLKTDGTEVSWGEALQNVATGENSVSIGTGSAALTKNSLAFGVNATAGTDRQAEFYSGGNISIGYGAKTGTYSASSTNGIAIGQSASATNTQAIAIGYQANTSGINGIAIGTTASAALGSIALGYSCKASTKGTFEVGLATSVSAYEQYRLLEPDGTIPTDRYTTTPTGAGTYVPKLTIAEDGTATREWGPESAISGEGTTGQVLTKTDDGFAWQDPAGGTKVIFREWEE